MLNEYLGAVVDQEIEANEIERGVKTITEEADPDQAKNINVIKGIIQQIFDLLNDIGFCGCLNILLFKLFYICRAGEHVHKECKKAGRVYKIIGDAICCSSSRCSIVFELDNQMSHATIYLAYKHEKNTERRFGYFYLRNPADLSFSIRFMTTEPFSAVKNDGRFGKSMRDLFPVDKLKNFFWRTRQREEIDDKKESRDAKIYCTKHFKQQFPERYDSARIQLQNIGAEFYEIPTNDSNNGIDELQIMFQSKSIIKIIVITTIT